MVVYKFGGSSVANKSAINKIKNIIKKDNERKIIVVSAFGRTKKEEEKFTDLLFRLCDLELKENIYKTVKNKMINYSANLGINAEDIFDFASFKKRVFENRDRDFIVSRGEYFTAKVLSIYFNCSFCPAESLLIFKKENFDFDLIKNYFAINNSQITIIPGFYCKEENGKIKLLERGGSDTTGAIISNALNCEYFNFTDVNGLLTIDNKRSNLSTTIPQLSYGQLYNCAKSGAQVFSINAIKYLTLKKLPLTILNTFSQTFHKTVIGEKRGDFYFFSDVQTAYFLTIKKRLKYRIIKGIFNTFMFDKTAFAEIYRTKKHLFFLTRKDFKPPLKTCHYFTLTLHGEKYVKAINQIIDFANSMKISVYLKRQTIPYFKTTVCFFGNFQASFFDKIISIIEKNKGA